MPEGDTIYRAARTLHRALAGRTVTGFRSAFPALTRVDHDTPVRGRRIERVESRGKHLLIRFSGGLVLRTHMRMHGSWHIYRPGERWQRAGHEMRIVIETPEFHAVGFSIPVVEFVDGAALERGIVLGDLGPDPLAADFDPAEASRRIAARAGVAIADALLDQSAIAGIGNVYKSELLFLAHVSPFADAGLLSREAVERIVALAAKYMRANVTDSSPGAIVTYGGLRRMTRRSAPGADYWVYGRAGKPCRRCGEPVRRARQGPHFRSTYWCDRCQAVGGGASVRGRDSGNHALPGRER